MDVPVSVLFSLCNFSFVIHSYFKSAGVVCRVTSDAATFGTSVLDRGAPSIKDGVYVVEHVWFSQC